MKHFDQHTLELYVLNAQEVADSRLEIDSHIAECIGCKLLVDEMAGFHAELVEDLKGPQAEAPVVPGRLTRRRYSIEPFAEPFGMPVSFAPRTAMEKFRYFVRRHPIVSGTGAFSALALLGLAGVLLLRPPADTNPAYVQFNDSSGRFEVNNKRHETLWGIPINGAALWQNIEDTRGTKQAIVLDLDGDGMNEVVTAIRFTVVPEYSQNALRIFDNSGKVVRQFEDTARAVFRGMSYNTPLQINGSFAIDSSAKEFFVELSNGRSPIVVRRLDGEGTVLGEYWHYGQLGAMYLRDIDRDGRPELVLCGINDVDDTKELSKPVFAVLDPRKIIGKKEATCTRGFGLPPSDAELYYVRLPFNEINTLESLNAQVGWMRGVDSTLEFEFNCALGENDADIVFVFTRELLCFDARPSTGTYEKFQSLFKEGRVNSVLTREHISDLVKKVAYWDGSGWRNGVTRVATGAHVGIP